MSNTALSVWLIIFALIIGASAAQNHDRPILDACEQARDVLARDVPVCTHEVESLGNALSTCTALVKRLSVCEVQCARGQQ